MIASLRDLEQRVGILEAGDATVAESLLRHASSLVRAEGNRRWDGTEDHPIPGQLVEVVVGMVERAVRNPDGAVQETTGPFTVSFGPAAAQRIYLTRGDRDVIRHAAGGGAFTINPTAPSTAAGSSTWDYT